jgi:putative endonuclease
VEKIGKKGESLAAQYLERQGFTIIERNAHIGHKEIDLIAEDKGTLVFIEVKTRTTDIYGSAEEAITKKKLENLEIALAIYLQKNSHYKNYRIDAITITATKPGKAILKHYPNLSSDSLN